MHLTRCSGWCRVADLVLQLDEPSLPAVWPVGCPPPRATGGLRAVDPQVAAAGLRDVLAAAGERRTAVHCCAPDLNSALLRGTGARALAVDTTLLGPRGWESVAATVESGVALWAGVLPTDGAATSVSSTVGALVDRWREVGLPVRRPRRRRR